MDTVHVCMQQPCNDALLESTRERNSAPPFVRAFYMCFLRIGLEMAHVTKVWFMKPL